MPKVTFSKSTVGPRAPSVEVEVNGVQRWFPAWWTVKVDDPRAPHVVTFELRAHPSGPVCVRYLIEPRQAGEGWRIAGAPTTGALNVLLRDAIAASASPVPLHGGTDSMTMYPESAHAVMRRTSSALAPRRRLLWTPERLREVADLYRAPGPPASPWERVRQGIDGIDSPYSARNAIHRARRDRDPETGLPYLGPAVGPRPGEQAPPANKPRRGRKGSS